MPHQILAAWQQKKGSYKNLFLSLPTSKREGEYLVGISLHNGNLIIAHECPASKCKRDCWHVDAALNAFKQWRWWEDYSQIKVLKQNRKIQLAMDWEQIPIPGESINFGTREEGAVHAS